MSLLGATAVRLGAREALCPTASVQAGDAGVFPTIAGRYVYDSRSIPIDQVKRSKEPVPTLSVYTETVRGVPRGNAQGSAPAEFTVDLVIEAEIAVYVPKAGASDEGVGWASSDASGEMLLDFLVAQARQTIVDAVGTGTLRRIVKRIVEFEAMPLRDFVSGSRINRRTLRMRCEVGDDAWNRAGGLPEPLASLRESLADGAYAVEQLDRIAAAIPAAPARVPLAEIRMTLGGIDGTAAEPPAEADIVVSAAFADAVPDEE